MARASAERRVVHPASPRASESLLRYQAIGDEIPAYCANPACRLEFRQSTLANGEGAYCSELCRLNARRDFDRTTARLAHFEALVEQLRADVATYGLVPVPPRHRLERYSERA